MDADWDEVKCPAFHTSGQPGEFQSISALAFDTRQELLWVGSNQGRVVSFYGPELNRYTAFVTKTDRDGRHNMPQRDDDIVRQFLFHDKGVLVLSTRSIHMAMRRGPAIWHIRHPEMKDLRCMSFTSKGINEILVAGFQDIMFVIDVNKGEIVKQLPTEHDYQFMKSSRYICAATRTGGVHMLDQTSFSIAKTWQPHVSYINDIDVQGEFIVTCGASMKQVQQYSLDPFVNIFDLKNMSSMSPMSFPPLAAHVRLHPRMQSTSIVLSQLGQMHIGDILNPTTSNVRYINIGFLTMFEIAPSGEALALADSEGWIHLWGSPTKIRFTDLAPPIELPDHEKPVDMLNWSMDTPLSSIGMPFYRETLFSALPPDLISDVGAPPVQFDQVFLATLKRSDWGLHGPNTRGFRRNQAEDTRAAGKTNNGFQAPKFLSEKAREMAMSPSLGAAAEIQGEQVADQVTECESLKATAPAMYRNFEIKYSKFGVDDFDFGFFNKTRYAGLENHIANSYANSLLQLMHYTPLLRNLALQHAASACLVDACLLCELGYIFDMLQKAQGSTCHATNLIKTLTNEPISGRLGILEEHSPNRTPAQMVQDLTRFLMDSINKGYRSIPPASTALEETLFNMDRPLHPDSLISKVLETSAVSHVKCINCKNEITKPETTLVNGLMYPPQKPNPRAGRAPRTIFSQALKMGVERETTSKGWCNCCERYQLVQMRRTIQSVPAVLAINTHITSPEHKALWATPGWLPEEIGVIVDQGQFFCFEGQDLKLHLQRGVHNMAVYSLIGMVVDVEESNGPKKKSHLVAMVNVAHSEEVPNEESQWHLFNDFSVRSVSTAEALTFNRSWKMPSVLLYQLKAANNKASTDWKTKLDTSILYKSLTSPPDGRTCSILNPMIERPGPETIVALDTEFVSVKQSEIQMNSDGERETIRPMSHALARVSVVRGQGEEEGSPFIDDYIAIKEPVVDYLTLYSGITAGDLDPKTSRHNLVPLKVAYKKLWVLLNLGCKFLGHGLKQDFRVINIQVPRAQVIDTIELFYLKSRLRKLSLAFLAWYLLKEDIQLETHDSIEDARTALKLYRKYLEFQDAGVLEPMLEDIYKAGRAFNFKPQRKDDQVVKRTDTPPIPQEAGGTPGPSTPLRRMGGANGGNGQSQGSGGGFGSGSGFAPGTSSPLR